MLKKIGEKVLNLEQTFASIHDSVIYHDSILSANTKTQQKYYWIYAMVKISIIAILTIVLSFFVIDGILYSFRLGHYFNIGFIILVNVLIYFYRPNLKTDSKSENMKKYPIYSKDVLICPHCLKNILIKNISEIRCPYCDAEGLTYDNAIYGCPHCGDEIKYLNCPHCHSAIDLFEPQNVEELKEKRYAEQ